MPFDQLFFGLDWGRVSDQTIATIGNHHQRAMGRDNFSERTIRTVALRAGYLCSNPDCRRPTSGAHSDPNRAIITGEAAHICAASENGPRYDPNQTSDDRKAITNAIWLCGVCNKKIDTDWAAWTIETLRQMKVAHEQWIAAEAMIPALPTITLATQSSLRFSRKLTEITAELQAALREQELVIVNTNRIDLFNFSLSLNLPEAVVGEGNNESPIGTHVRVRSVQPANSVFVKGNASATEGPPIPTLHHVLEADKLATNAKIVSAFYTIKPVFTMPYDLFRLNPGSDWEDPEKMDEHKECHFYLEGTYQFLLRNEYVTGNFFVPLLFKAEPRTVTSYPVQDSSFPWKVWSGTISRGATLGVGGVPQA